MVAEKRALLSLSVHFVVRYKIFVIIIIIIIIMYSSSPPPPLHTWLHRVQPFCSILKMNCHIIIITFSTIIISSSINAVQKRLVVIKSVV